MVIWWSSVTLGQNNSSSTDKKARWSFYFYPSRSTLSLHRIVTMAMCSVFTGYVVYWTWCTCTYKATPNLLHITLGLIAELERAKFKGYPKIRYWIGTSLLVTRDSTHRFISVSTYFILFFSAMTARRWIVVTVVLFSMMVDAKPFEFENEVTTTLEMRLNYLEKRIADIEKCTRESLLYFER